MEETRKQAWEDSYARRENFIFYPKEEVVKFLNRYIRKRTGISSFEEKDGLTGRIRGLDLGCGIGRQTVLLEEFGIEAYGADISERALHTAREVGTSFGFDLGERLVRLDGTTLPFPADYFHFAISDSVLDSMHFDLAQAYMRELNRTVTHYVYLNLISGASEGEDFAEDVIVRGRHEQDTIQSYYNRDKLQRLIGGTDFQIISLEQHTLLGLLSEKNRIRYHVILKRK